MIARIALVIMDNAPVSFLGPNPEESLKQLCEFEMEMYWELSPIGRYGYVESVKVTESNLLCRDSHCGNCKYYDRSEHEYPCDVCEPVFDRTPTKWELANKPQTNADHIRGMTDEKLAELFAGMCQANADGESHCDACLFNAWCPACGYEDDWLEWLQQPYKENEDDR